ncbi:hypothetical protein B0H21DRAFT_777052 [Amylocystis lapponica]|nr:hypothetical protein B0H21DRAFT_777052 [Amylocystis lapponica]
MDFDLGLDVDHRKRRRNRTTQSCLNCHTSKRKCDRKRPCQRCIQLGLTGLCVYEVDDPASRDDPNIDESTRLRNRIAELESLVRELRGKPHPRWAEPNFCDGDATEKWHSRSSKRLQSQFQRQRRDGFPDVVHPSDGVVPHISSVKPEPSVEISQHSLYRFSPQPSNGSAYSPAAQYPPTYTRNQNHPTHNGSSSPEEESAMVYSSASSSSSMGYQDHRVADASGHIHGDQYPYLRPVTVDSVPHHSCSCISNPAAANPLIALTNQLRHTMHSIRQLPEHHSHHQCLIVKRVLELDDILHGNSQDIITGSSYEALPTPTESETMSPISTSSHSSLGTSMHDWPNMASSSGYDAYFPVSPGEHGAYQKTYHLH